MTVKKKLMIELMMMTGPCSLPMAASGTMLLVPSCVFVCVCVRS